MKTILTIISFIVFFSNTSLIYCQSNLTIFDDFVGKEWIGCYQDSEDSLLVHTIKWQYDLNKQVVKEIKIVSAVNFYCETYYYCDYENDQISYLSFVNKEMLSKGIVILKKGKLELNGKTFFNNGFQINRKTFEITKEGKLKDYFFRMSQNKWIQGHFIQYTKKNNGRS